VLDVVSKLREELEDFSNSVTRHVFRRELDKRFDHWSIRVEISEVGESFDLFSNFFNFTFKLDPTSTLM